MIVYHYTSEDNYEQITRTRQFLPSFFSAALDAAYGEGWYFTDLDPFKDDQELFYQLWRHPEPLKVRRYLVFDIDPTLLQRTRPHVYRLPLDSLKDTAINLDLEYKVDEKVIIHFLGGGSR